MRFRAILLDLDDTLFDRTSALRAWAEQTVQTQLGRSLTETDWRTLRELDGRGHRSRAQLAADARTHLGLAIDPDLFAHALAAHVVPEAGVRETIADLATRCRVAIVTNGGAAQRVKLAALGLDRLVHAVFVSSEVGATKPAFEIFDRALRWTEHGAGDVMFVGDDPVIDLGPAAALGMATAWRVRDHAWPRELAAPTYRIDSISALAELA